MSEMGNEMKMSLWLRDISHTEKLGIGHRGYSPEVGLSGGKIQCRSLCLECMAIAFMSCSCANARYVTMSGFQKTESGAFSHRFNCAFVEVSESHSRTPKALWEDDTYH